MKRSSLTTNIMSIVWWIIISIVSSFLCIGCPGSPSAPKAEQEAAKKFVPEPGKAIIYIYRDTMVAAIQMFRIYLDGGLVGDSKNQAFFRQVVTPGPHQISVSNLRGTHRDSLSISTDAGKIYYIELEIGPNPVSGIPKLKIADETGAQSTIRRCALLQSGTSAMSR